MTLLTRGAYADPGTARAYLTGNWRNQRPVHAHASAPCHSACPAGEDAQAWLAHVQAGDNRRAFETIAAVNPLPAITGRVCHHPCETGCNRGQLDEPVAIHAVERFLGDEAIRHGWALPVPEGAPEAGDVAVVGAGPAGLSAAFHLRRRGYRVTLFDDNSVPGGMLSAAIPPFRLPRSVLDAEIGRLLATGIRFEPNRRLGRDMHLDELGADFGAVLLAPGCHRPRPWPVDGADTADSPTGVALLREWLNLGAVPPGIRRAVIHGGGNTAMDVARLLAWSGAEVHVVAASSLPGEAGSDDPMAAIPREVEEAVEEGIVFHPRHTLTRLIVRDGHIRGAELTAVRKLPAPGHGTQRIAFEGTEIILDADLVVPAVGETVEPFGMEAILAGRSHIRTDATGAVAGHAGVFAGGDAAGGAGTVSGAIGSGRRTAAAIDAFFRRQAALPDTVPPPIAFAHLNTAYFDHATRRKPPSVAVAARGPEIEVETSYEASAAHAEAGRCLSCGNCMACDNCWTFCPEPAVLKTRVTASDGSHYVFDYDFCKGCGVCARECPTGFIGMIDEATV